jgi:hypothetical protein
MLDIIEKLVLHIVFKEHEDLGLIFLKYNRTLEELEFRISIEVNANNFLSSAVCEKIVDYFQVTMKNFDVTLEVCLDDIIAMIDDADLEIVSLPTNAPNLQF